MHNLNDYAGVILIFFGYHSLLTIGLQSWIIYISSNLLVYESLAASDCGFIAKLLTAIGSRDNFWLEEYTSKPSRCNIDDELLNFDDMQCMIKTRQFSFSLPPAVRQHTSKQPSANHHDLNNSRDDSSAKRSPVQNQNRGSPWKVKQNEDYKAIFDNANSSKRPTLDGVCLCPQ